MTGSLRVDAAAGVVVAEVVVLDDGVDEVDVAGCRCEQVEVLEIDPAVTVRVEISEGVVAEVNPARQAATASATAMGVLPASLLIKPSVNNARGQYT
ncbi:hypothetical protein [Streptosporangium sp. KLBMP 9127]|nr:hypothetical protein [Streptosporangium sp. KLBMP 9127]